MNLGATSGVCISGHERLFLAKPRAVLRPRPNRILAGTLGEAESICIYVHFNVHVSHSLHTIVGRQREFDVSLPALRTTHPTYCQCASVQSGATSTADTSLSV